MASVLLKGVIFGWSDRTPIALTPACSNKAVRYADGEFDSQFNRIIIVREGKYSWLFLCLQNISQLEG